MGYKASDPSLPSPLHCNPIHKGHGDRHDQRVVKADEPPQEHTSWFSAQEEDHPQGFYSQYKVYDPTATDNNKVNDFLAVNQQSTRPTLPPPQSNCVQSDCFSHSITPPLQSILQPIEYDRAAVAQPHQQQQLPASETTSGKPAALPRTQEKHQTFSLASLELLNNYWKGFQIASREENLININTIPRAVTNESNSINTASRTHRLALGEIIKVAGERYIQSSTQKVHGFSTSVHPYGSSVIKSELSAAEITDVELVQILLIAAECVGHRQFDLASSLIARCMWIASEAGTAAQRIVFYFAGALQCRVDIETGRTSLERLNQQSSYARSLELDFSLSFLACHQALPFIQVTQFAAMQTIVDNLKSATKIHLVDLHIRSGVQWTVLMQALLERDDLPEIRISAVGTNNKSHLEETGKRLLNFAQSLNLSLSFNAIIVSDMKELKEDMFRREPDEAVAVYAAIILRTMLSKADSLANVMTVMRRLKPAVMVVTEVEANHNSPSFVSRFTESLFFYGAFFDCLEDCMERNDKHRKIMEGIYLGEGIRNMVGMEGDKRCSRNVRMDVWREYFARYGMAEIELGDASIRQAKLIVKKFHKGGCCNITGTGKGLVVGWKGTPLHSLTTWKFV